MEVTLEKTGELEGRLVVKVQEADYADRVKSELKEIGKNRQIPGFRKGHVDMAQLQKRFGKEVKAHVLNEVASDAALKYVEDNKLDLLGHPLPVVDEEFDLNNADFTFVYEIGLAPAVDLHLDKNTILDYYNIEVTDKMIDDQAAEMLQRAGEQVPAQEYAPRALVKGTIMQLADDGSVLADGIQVTDGILAPFLFKNADEAAKFEGTKVGDKVVFDAWATCDGNEAELASMLHIERDQVEKARGNFEITIDEFIVHQPATLGQEFYDKVFGSDRVHNEEEFRAAVRDMIARALQPNSQSLFTRMTEDYLMDTYGAPMQLPLGFLRRFLLATNDELKEEAADTELEHAVPGIKWEIIENKAAEALEVKVTEDDVKAYAHMLAVEQLEQYGMGHMADQMADYFAENMLKDENQRRSIVRRAFNGKLMAAIHSAVTLNEHTVTLDQFKEMVSALNATSAETPEGQAAEGIEAPEAE